MYYDDDENPIDPTQILMSDLCLSCEKKDDSREKILCNLNRLDQQGNADFKCYAYRSLYGSLDDDIIVESPN